jgi:hypothetical protein
MKDARSINELSARKMEGHLRVPFSDFLGLMATPAYLVAGLPNSVLASI